MSAFCYLCGQSTSYVMVDDGPIKLNFEYLKDYVISEAPQNSEYTYISKHFAVVYSFRHVLKGFLHLGQPYRLDELRIARVISGTVKITINLLDYEYHEGMLFYVSGGSIVQPNYFSPDFDMEAVSVSDDLVQMLYKGMVPSCFLGGDGFNNLLMTELEKNVFHKIIETLWATIHYDNIDKEVTYSLLTAILNLFKGINDRNAVTTTHSSSSRERSVFLNFIRFVHQYSKKERKLSFYADKMCLSQHYLSTIIRQATDCTAKEWIEKSVISEAKVLLKYSNLLTYQISDELNFNNPSFFCKFFKRLTGMTPQQYQES